MRGKTGKTDQCLLAIAAAFFLWAACLQAREAGSLPESGFRVTTEAGEDFHYELPGPCDLNTATAEELARLPGIGEVLAERILRYREENGPFQTAEELLNVPGIGEKKLEALRPEVTVGEIETENDPAPAGDSSAAESAGKGESHADPGGG